MFVVCICVGISISFLSYKSHLRIGLIIDNGIIPDGTEGAQRLIDGMIDELYVMAKSVGVLAEGAVHPPFASNPGSTNLIQVAQPEDNLVEKIHEDKAKSESHSTSPSKTTTTNLRHRQSNQNDNNNNNNNNNNVEPKNSKETKDSPLNLQKGTTEGPDYLQKTVLDGHKYFQRMASRD